MFISDSYRQGDGFALDKVSPPVVANSQPRSRSNADAVPKKTSHESEGPILGRKSLWPQHLYDSNRKDPGPFFTADDQILIPVIKRTTRFRLSQLSFLNWVVAGV